MPSTALGPLVQSAGPTEGDALRAFLHHLFRDVTALAGDLVRPMWQPEPPAVPAATVNWIGFGIVTQTPDANAYHDQTSDTAAQVVRHEELEILCACYGPLCTDYAARLRDALELSQNRDTLRAAGMGLVEVSAITHAPELVNARWLDRADVYVVLRREVRRTYAVYKFLAATGTVVEDSSRALTRTFTA